MSHIKWRTSLGINRFTTNSGGSDWTSSHESIPTSRIWVRGYATTKYRSPIDFPTHRVFSIGINRRTMLGGGRNMCDISCLWFERLNCFWLFFWMLSLAWEWALKTITELSFPTDSKGEGNNCVSLELLVWISLRTRIGPCEATLFFFS